VLKDDEEIKLKSIYKWINLKDGLKLKDPGRKPN
jgi:hypothetical protein